MKTSKLNIHFSLLAALVSLSVFELNGNLAAVLLICIAGALWLVAMQANVLVPPIAFVAVAYILGYSMPMLLSDLYTDLWNKVPFHSLEYGMLWAVRGFGAFAFGYALIEYHGKRKKSRPPISENLVNKRWRYTVYLLKSIGLLVLLAWLANTALFGISLVFIEKDIAVVDTGHGTLVQVLTLLFNLRYPFFLAYLVLHYKKQTNRALSFLFMALLLVSIIEIVVIGSKGAIIRLLLMVVLAQSFLHVRFNIKQIVRVVLMLIFVYGAFAVITEYRWIMQAENRAGRNVFDLKIQVESFKSALLFSVPFAENSDKRQTTVDSRTTLNRFGSSMFSFANLLKFTSLQSPYEHALESFFTPIYSFIPRSLMPGKPEFFNSGSNAKKYYGWSYGGISVSLLGSFYYAWGYTGVIFGMFFLGACLAYVMKRTDFSNIYALHYLIVFVTLFLFLMDVGVTFQVFIINIIRVIFLLYLLHCLYPLVHRSKRRYKLRVATPQAYKGHQ